MKRRTRLALLALGAVLISGLVATLAPLTDSTETGTNSVEAAQQGVVRDLKIATGVGASSTANCAVIAGPYIDNQSAATPVIAITGGTPTTTYQRVHLCLKNVGSETATITTADIFDLTDVDTGCTGDEPDVDATCGSGDSGELASEVRTQFFIDQSGLGDANAPCGGSAQTLFQQDGIANATLTGSGSGATLPAGHTACVEMYARYDSALTTPGERTENQTDKVTFRVRFNAT